MAVLSNFGLAILKPEGSKVEYVAGEHSTYTGPKTTYVERRIPVELEAAAHSLINVFLLQHGYDPKEI